MRKFGFGLALALLLSSIGPANAASITLFNTGVDASGTPLADGTIGDPHYSLISVPGGTTDIRVRTSAGGFPIGPWLGDNATSAWIGPNNDAQVDGPVGVYVYQITFDLTGLNPLTASISGGWSTDNPGLAIYLNGVDTLNPGTADNQFQIGFASFSISTGFTSGINTLDFYVLNQGGPTGLRVEMSGTADASATPEPGSLALAGMGIFGLAAYGRRRRAKVAV